MTKILISSTFAFLHHCSLYDEGLPHISAWLTYYRADWKLYMQYYEFTFDKWVSMCARFIAAVSTPQATMATQRLAPCGSTTWLNTVITKLCFAQFLYHKLWLFKLRFLYAQTHTHTHKILLPDYQISSPYIEEEKMAPSILQNAGLLLGVIGASSLIAATVLNKWSLRDRQDDLLDNVYVHSGLWEDCWTTSSGLTQCHHNDGILGDAGKRRHSHAIVSTF